MYILVLTYCRSMPQNIIDQISAGFLEFNLFCYFPKDLSTRKS